MLQCLRCVHAHGRPAGSRGSGLGSCRDGKGAACGLSRRHRAVTCRLWGRPLPLLQLGRHRRILWLLCFTYTTDSDTARERGSGDGVFMLHIDYCILVTCLHSTCMSNKSPMIPLSWIEHE